MAGFGAWLIALVTTAGTALAFAVLAVALFMCGIAFASGNRQLASAWAVGGLLGTGVMLFAPAISTTVQGIARGG